MEPPKNKKEIIDYDVEFYKIGQSCNGLKKRHAIIKPGQLFSSTIPVSDYLKMKDKKKAKLKEKTKYLDKSEVFLENFDNAKNLPGEWSNKKKNYRMRIIYDDKEAKKKKGFFFYFQTRDHMYECEEMLFGERRRRERNAMLGPVAEDLKKLTKNTEDNFMFYAILKLLAEKEKAKAEKPESIKSEIKVESEPEPEPEPKLRAAPPKKEKYKLNYPLLLSLKDTPYNLETNEQNILLPLDDDNANLLFNPSQDKLNALNVLQSKIENVKNGNEDKNKFPLVNPIEFKNRIHGNHIVDEDVCNNATNFDLDKNNCVLNINSEDNNSTQLSGDEILKISNVLLNGNIEGDENNPNSLVLYGPKIDPDKGISYNYKQKNPNEEGLSFNPNLNYTDPENAGLKFKSSIYNNDLNDNNIENDLICLQVFQLIYKMNPNELDSLASQAEKRGININKENPINDFYFYHSVELGNGLKKNSKLVPAKTYNYETFVVEFDNQYCFNKNQLDKNGKFKINSYAIPIECLDKNLTENEKRIEVDYLNPYLLGNSIVTKNDINNNRYEYPLFKNNDQLEEPTKLLTLPLEEKSIDAKPSLGFRGKDYSIGDNIYFRKKLDKKTIDDGLDNNEISNETKDKYFKFNFDDNDNILFRPPENLDLDEFKDDISKQISQDELDKIIENDKFKFLPQCEKYSNPNELYLSKNLQGLTKDQKEFIVQNFNPGDWIYKSPDVYVKEITKNLGVIENNNNNINQFKYFNEKEQNYLNEILTDPKQTFSLRENNFNVLDFNDLNEIKGLDNYQWAMKLDFENKDEMNKFLNNLQDARQNLQLKKNLEDDEKIDVDKLLNILKFDNINNFINVNIKEIEFRLDEEFFDSDTTMNISIENATQKDSNRKSKSLIENFDLENYHFKNSLLDDPKINEALKKIQENKGEKVEFPEMIKKKEEKNIYGKNNQLKKNIPVKKGINKDFNVNLNFTKNNGQTQEFVSPISLSKIIDNNKKDADIFVIPIYNKNVPDKIYGALHLDCSNNDDNFDECYINSNKDEIKKGLFFDSLGEPLILGEYEPNVFRRKVLNNINKIDQNDVKKKYLDKECVLLNNYDPDFIKMNTTNDINIHSNTYKKKIGLTLLRNKKRVEFNKIFANTEWLNFFRLLLKNPNLPFSEDIFDFYPKDRSKIFSNEKLLNNFKNIIYFGIPHKFGREKTWEFLLEVDKLHEKTKEKIQNNLDKSEIYNLYSNEENFKGYTNIIFSLIDNDTNLLININNFNEQRLNSVKKIAKAFYKWTEEKIFLNNDKNTEYVYWFGILSIINRLYQYYKNEEITFWMIIGLSQFVSLFKQQNPLYDNELNYINEYILIIKLILQNNFPQIYQKFLSLNYPVETFLSKNISCLYSDYFNNDIFFRIMDIFLFEINSGDSLEYLRFLCSIPLTLFMLSEEDILHTNSVSELETILNGMIIKTYETNKFINILRNNVEKFYSYSNIFEKWFNLNKDIQWNDKFVKMKDKILSHFNSVKKDNEKYLKNIYNCEKIYENPELFNTNYSNDLNYRFEKIRNLYGSGTPQMLNDDKNVGITFRINKIKPLTSKNKLYDQMRVEFYFSDVLDRLGDVAKETEFQYDKDDNMISEGNDLIINKLFHFKIPKYLIIKLYCKRDLICTFPCNIKNFDLMIIKKETIESYDNENEKYLCEICVFKYLTSTDLVTSDEISLFNSIFTAPEYIHNINIENELNSYKISDSRSFNNALVENITNENNSKYEIINDSLFNKSQVFKDFFRKNNQIPKKPDDYNKIDTEKIIKKNSSDKFNVLIANKVEEILNNIIQENSKNIVMDWLNDKNNSFEEILYSLVIIDKNSYTISEKLFLLFSIAQMKNKILFNSEDVSIDKIKEMIYALYKRFMIYFTKNEVDRMIDYKLKNERLLNIKYVFIYKSNDEVEINKIIFDRANYSPNVKTGKIKENNILYDNIDIKFNIYLNYFVNHYNMKSLSKENIILILKTIIENSEDLSKYKNNSFDEIKIVIEKDNIQYNRTFKLDFSKGINIEELSKYEIKPQNDMKDPIDVNLCKEVLSLELINSYTKLDEITFDKFKELFFNLPFLSDLLRISSSFISNVSNVIQINNELESLKVSVCYRKFNGDEILYGIFYFGNYNEDEEENSDAHIVKKIDRFDLKSSTTIDEIFKIIYANISQIKSKCKISKNEICEALKNPLLFDVYVVKHNKIEDKIMFYESLYSNISIKNSNSAELKIIVKDEEIELTRDQIIIKKDGYGMIYIGNPNNEYEWRKCKIKNFQPELISVDYKTKPQLGHDEIIENIEILRENDIISPIGN